MSRKADVLAGETGADEIHGNEEVFSSQGAYVRPDGGHIQFSFLHSFEEDGLAVGVLFAVGDGPGPGPEGEGDSTNAAEEVEGMDHAARP